MNKESQQPEVFHFHAFSLLLPLVFFIFAMVFNSATRIGGVDSRSISAVTIGLAEVWLVVTVGLSLAARNLNTLNTSSSGEEVVPRSAFWLSGALYVCFFVFFWNWYMLRFAPELTLQPSGIRVLFILFLGVLIFYVFIFVKAVVKQRSVATGLLLALLPAGPTVALAFRSKGDSYVA